MSGKRKALVTGSTGFIGQHLVRSLRDQNWEVECYRDDICNITSYKGSVDVVFHLAAVPMRETANVPQAELFRVNVNGTYAVLTFCQQNGAKCIFASSASVYGSSDTRVPVTENYRLEPLNLYGVSKLMAELLCKQFAQLHNTSVVILRIFNAYGPGQNNSYLIPSLFEHALNEICLEIRTPNAYRDFVYVTDVIAAFLLVANECDVDGMVLNVSSGVAQNVLDLVKKVSDVASRHVEYKLAADNNNLLEASYMVGSNRSLIALGWQMKVPLSEGIKQCAV